MTPEASDALDVLNALLAAVKDPRVPAAIGNTTIAVDHQGGPQVARSVVDELLRLGYVDVGRAGIVLTPAGALAQLAELAGWATPPTADGSNLVDLCAAEAATLGLGQGWPRDLVDDRIRPLLDLALGR